MKIVSLRYIFICSLFIFQAYHSLVGQTVVSAHAQFLVPLDVVSKADIGNALGASMGLYFVSTKHDQWNVGAEIAASQFKSQSIIYLNDLVLFRNALIIDDLPASIRGDESHAFYTLMPKVKFYPSQNGIQFFVGAGGGVAIMHSKMILNDISLNEWYITNNKNYINRQVTKNNFSFVSSFDIGVNVDVSPNLILFLQTGVMYTGALDFFDSENNSTWKLDFKAPKYDRDDILPATIELVDPQLPLTQRNLFLYNINFGIQFLLDSKSK